MSKVELYEILHLKGSQWSIEGTWDEYWAPAPPLLNLHSKHIITLSLCHNVSLPSHLTRMKSPPHHTLTCHLARMKTWSQSPILLAWPHSKHIMMSLLPVLSPFSLHWLSPFPSTVTINTNLRVDYQTNSGYSTWRWPDQSHPIPHLAPRCYCDFSIHNFYAFLFVLLSASQYFESFPNSCEIWDEDRASLHHEPTFLDNALKVTGQHWKAIRTNQPWHWFTTPPPHQFLFTQIQICIKSKIAAGSTHTKWQDNIKWQLVNSAAGDQAQSNLNL